MFDVHAVPSGGSTLALDVDVVVIDHGAHGIARVDVHGRDGAPIAEADGACAASLVVHCAAVPALRLPLTVLVTECVTNLVEPHGPFLDPMLPSLGTGMELCTPLFGTPPSAACSSAVNAATAARRSFMRDCDRLHHDTDLRNAYIAAAAAASAAAAGLAAAAVAAATIPIYGGIVAAILAVVAYVFLWLAGFFSGLAIGYGLAADSDAAQLANDRTAFDMAVDSVRLACCPEHRDADLTSPTC